MSNKLVNSFKTLMIKILIIILGCIISAYGITLAIHAGFGAATLAVLWEGVSSLLGVSLGVSSLIIATIMVAFVIFYDKRQINIGTVVYQVVYSLSVDFFSNLQRYTPYVPVNFVLMILGIIVFAIGTGIYAWANLGRGAYEALTFALSEKSNYPLKSVRMFLDVIAVVIGVILGGKFGLCTVATLLLSGFFIQKTVYVLNKIKKMLLKK